MKINPIKLLNKNYEIILRSPDIFEGELLLFYFRKLFHESSFFLNFERS
jgi:hypothetical protein